MFNNSNSSSSSTSNKKNRLGKANSVNSPLTNELYTNFSHKKQQQQQQQQFKTSTISKQLNSVTKSTNSSSSSSSNTAQITTTYIPAKSKRDQTCQTNLTIPFDFDLSKIPELNKFLLNDNQINELSPFKKEELNNSIRKKLFDHNSEDSASTVTTTNNKTPVQKSALLTKLKSSDLSHLKHSNELKHISQLPKPEIYSSKSNHLKKLQQPRTLAASSSSSNNTDDCWHDSFEFDDHQFASSPKNEKYSNILHDIGGGGGGCDDEELSDSVFHHRTPPDLSPLLDRSQTNHNHSNIIIINNNINSPKIDYQFEPIHSASKLLTNNKNEKCLNSPNLSPIRQQHESTNCTLKTSNNKLKNSQFNSSSSNSHAKSIIFMDIGGNNSSSNNNKSFSESITDNINSNETCRYSQESNENNNNNNNNRKSLNDTKLTTNNNNNNANHTSSTKRISINKTKKNNTAGSTSSSNGSCSSSSNKPAFLLLTSMMSETTTNTFNQDSQDTGYQTTSVVNGSNGSNTTTSNMNSNNTNNNVNNPSIITMDMTQNNNEFTNNCLFLSSTSTSLSTSNHKRLFNPSTSNSKLITNKLVTSSTPMNIEIEDEQLQNKENSIQTNKAIKRPSLDLNNKKENLNNNKTEKMKKNSVSLNSLENIKPIEASTPQMLKYSSFNYSNSKSSFKPVNKSTTTTATTTSLLDQKKKVNFYKSKTISFEPTSQQVLFNFYNNDVSMSSSTNTSNLMFSTDAVINDDLIIKKNEIDSIYVEQSILMNKISPSK